MELHPAVCTYGEFRESVEAVILPLCRRKKIHFVNEYRSVDTPLYADGLRLNQIFFNLFSNAVKFTPEGGTVRFSGEGRRHGENVLLNFSVSDTGVGMSREFQQHMFEPFSQESSRVVSPTQGTGLGLGIAKALIEMMGGTISVRSENGKGSEFLIHLKFPAAKEDGGEKEPTADYDFGGGTILVAEDHPMNRMILVRLLEKKNAAVQSAENGREALECFRRSAPNSIRAIFMDIRMPEMDGLTAAAAIRALPRPDAKTVPIIATTANAYDEDRKKSRNAGMDAHLAKPVDANLLYRTLWELLHRNIG